MEEAQRGERQRRRLVSAGTEVLTAWQATRTIDLIDGVGSLGVGVVRPATTRPSGNATTTTASTTTAADATERLRCRVDGLRRLVRLVSEVLQDAVGTAGHERVGGELA